MARESSFQSSMSLNTNGKRKIMYRCNQYVQTLALERNRWRGLVFIKSTLKEEDKMIIAKG